MVAPVSDGRIMRSMVRIPGSGVDEGAGIMCLNLGNVSNLAAMIPVPQTLSVNSRNGHVQLKSSFGISANPKQAQVVQDRDEHSLKSEDFTDSPRSESTHVASNNVHTRDITTVISSEVNASSVSRSSRLKRPIRKDSEGCSPSTVDSEGCSPPTVVSEGCSPSKRSRVISTPSIENSEGRFPSALVQEAAKINWVLPTGTSRNNYNTRVLPMNLAPPSTSNTHVVIPVGMAQVNSQVTPVVLPTASAKGKTSPAFVLRANAGNVSGAVTPQVPQPQPPPSAVLMVPAQSFPVLYPTVPNRDLQKITQERDILREENQVLKYRLSRFQQLLGNKERMIRVLRHLEAVQA